VAKGHQKAKKQMKKINFPLVLFICQAVCTNLSFLEDVFFSGE
jgi:hypothetical protein